MVDRNPTSKVGECLRRPGHRCPIKAQATARVGRVGTSLDFAKKRALERLEPAAWKWGFCALHTSLHILSCLIYLNLR